MKDNIQFWATAVSPIISMIAIIVALYVSKKSSKDIFKLIDSNHADSTNQIREIRTVSVNEIHHLRLLIHSLIIVAIHYLKDKNINANKEKQELEKILNRLLVKYKKIKEWKVDVRFDINVEEINYHFSEMHELEAEMLSLLEKFKRLSESSISISDALEGLERPINDIYESKQK